MPEEFDDLGIPIRTPIKQETHDEFGIPLKKKDQSSLKQEKEEVSGKGGLTPTQPLEKSGVNELKKTELPLSQSQKAQIDARKKAKSTSKPLTEEVGEYANTVLSSIQRGWKQGELSAKFNRTVESGQIAKSNPHFEDIYSQDLADLADLSDEVDKIHQTKSVKDFEQAKEGHDSWEAFKKNPLDIATSVVLQSGAALLSSTLNERSRTSPGIEAPVIHPSQLMAEKGYNLGMASDMIASLQESGVDLKSAESIKSALEDENKIAEIYKKAQARNVPIAIVDAFTGAIATKIVGKMAKAAMPTILNKAKQIATGAVIETSGAMGGEALGQISSEGKITSTQSVLLEGLGELTQGAPNIVSGMMSNKADIQSVENNNEVAQPQQAPTTQDENLSNSTEQTVSEKPETLQLQQEALIEGRQKAQMFPNGTEELPLPEGIERVETPAGIFHYDPSQTTEEEIKQASDTGKLNEVLGLGPVSKKEAIESGEPLIAVTERDQQGTEVKAAVVPESRAEETAIDMGQRTKDGHTIQTESTQSVIDGRLTEQIDIGKEGLSTIEKREADVIPQISQHADEIVKARLSEPQPESLFKPEPTETVQTIAPQDKIKKGLSGLQEKLGVPESKPLPSKKKQIKNTKNERIKNQHRATPTAIARGYFIDGGKALWQSPDNGKTKKGVKEELGYGEGERRSLIGILSKNGLGIEEIAHSLWENQPVSNRYSTSDFRDAIISVLSEDRKTWYDLQNKETSYDTFSDKYIEENAEKFDQIEQDLLEASKIIDEEGITKENIHKLEVLFNGFPYTPQEFENVKSKIYGEQSERINAEVGRSGETIEPRGRREGVEEKTVDRGIAANIESKIRSLRSAETEAEKRKIAKEIVAKTGEYILNREGIVVSDDASFANKDSETFFDLLDDNKSVYLLDEDAKIAKRPSDYSSLADELEEFSKNPMLNEEEIASINYKVKIFRQAAKEGFVSFDDVLGENWDVIKSMAKDLGYDGIQILEIDGTNSTIQLWNYEKLTHVGGQELTGKAKIAEGLSRLANKLGITKNIVPEQYSSIFDDLMLIAEGLLEETGKVGLELIAELKKYLKDKGYTKLAKDIDSFSDDILEAISIKKEQESAKSVDEKLEEWNKSKWVKTYNDSQDDNIERPDYLVMKEPDVKKAAIKLINDKGGIHIAEHIKGLVSDKISSSLEDIKNYTVAAILTSNELGRQYRKAIEDNDTNYAQKIKRIKDELVTNISLIGTALGQNVKVLDPNWLNSVFGELDDPQDIVHAMINSALAKPSLDNVIRKTGDKEVGNKVEAVSFDILKTVKEQLYSDTEIGKEIKGIVSKIIAEANKTSKTASKRNSRIDNGITNKRLTKEKINSVAAKLREKAQEMRDELKGQANDILYILGTKFTATVMDLIATGLEKYGNIRSAVKYATDASYEAYKNTYGPDKNVNGELRRSINDLTYEYLGIDKPEKKVKPEKTEDEIREMQEAVSEVEKAIVEATQNGVDASEVTRRLNKYLLELEGMPESKSQKFQENDAKSVQKSADKEAQKRLVNEQKEREKQINEQARERSKEALESIKKMLSERFDIKDGEKLNKVSRDILGGMLLNPNHSDVSGVSTSIMSLLGGNDINPTALATAQVLAKKGQTYPKGSAQRTLLTSQAMQIIANQQPINYARMFKTFRMANMLNGFSTLSNIFFQNVFAKESEANKFGGRGFLPFFGRFTARGKLIRQIYDNQVLGEFAKANLINGIMNGDVRGSALFKAGDDETVLKRMAKDDVLRLADKMQESINPVERTFGNYLRLLYAPLRAIQIMDSNPQTYMDTANMVRLMYESMRKDKNMSESEILDKIKDAINIFNNEAIEEASKQALKEGYQEGKEPNTKTAVINMLAGRFEPSNFTKDEMDWVSHKIRVNEILQGNAEKQYSETAKGQNLTEDAITLSNRAFMKEGRSQHEIDKESGELKDKIGLMTTGQLIKLNSQVDAAITSMIADNSESIYKRYTIQGTGLALAAYKLAKLPFARMVAISISRTGDYFPIIGGLKALYYGILPWPPKMFQSNRDIVEAQNTMHRQMIGLSAMVGAMTIAYWLQPDDDEEKRKKQKLTFEISPSPFGSKSKTVAGLANKYGGDQLVFNVNGKTINIPYGNAHFAPTLTSIGLMVAYQNDPKKVIGDNDPSFVGNAMTFLGIATSSAMGKSYNKGIMDMLNEVVKISQMGEDEDKSKAIGTFANKGLTNIPKNTLESLIPYGNLVEQIVQLARGTRPDKKTMEYIWLNCLPYSDKLTSKPALDFLGKPIPQAPSESTNPIYAATRQSRNPYSDAEADVRDFILYNGLLPQRFPSSLDVKIKDPLNNEIVRKGIENAYEVERQVGESMLKYCMKNKPEWEESLKGLEGKKLQEKRNKLREKIKDVYRAKIEIFKRKQYGVENK